METRDVGQVWYVIVSIPDLCPLFYFEKTPKQNKFPIIFITKKW